MFIVIFENKLKRVWKKYGHFNKNAPRGKGRLNDGFYVRPGEYTYCQVGRRILCKLSEVTGKYLNVITGEEVILTKNARVEAI
jgi:hypothetical protein